MAGTFSAESRFNNSGVHFRSGPSSKVKEIVRLRRGRIAKVTDHVGALPDVFLFGGHERRFHLAWCPGLGQ